MSFFYTTRFFGWNFLPPKVRDFENNKFATMQRKWHLTITLSRHHYNILKIHYNSTDISPAYYCLSFAVTFTQETLQNMDSKFKLWQKTVCLVQEFTQALNILHNCWSRWSWHFACLHYTQTVRARELKFWENVHPQPRVTCQVSSIRCQV